MCPKIREQTPLEKLSDWARKKGTFTFEEARDWAKDSGVTVSGGYLLLLIEELITQCLLEVDTGRKPRVYRYR